MTRLYRPLVLICLISLTAGVMYMIARVIGMGQHFQVVQLNTINETKLLTLLDLLAINAIGSAILLQQMLGSKRRPIVSALGIALLLFVFWECEARLAFAAAPSLYVRDVDLGVDFSPCYDQTHPPIGRIHINSLGARSDEPSGNDGRRPLKVLCLGDSTLFGVGLDQADIFSSVLQGDLQARFPDRRVEVMNIARPGSYAAVGVWLLKYRWIGWKPDIVVAAYNNDSGSTYSAPLAPPTTRTAWPFPFRSLALYRLLGQVIAHEQTRLHPLHLHCPTPTVDLFKYSLHEMSTLVQPWGGTAIFISLPHFVNERGLSSDFRKAARQQMKADNGVFADLETAIPQESSYYLNVMNDPVHLSARGNLTLERALLPTVASLVR